jgi:SAM-dependent methyltransferase
MIVELSSTNDKFTYIIYKNPNNELGGFIGRDLKKGKLLGFFKDGKFISYFQDSPDETSYSDDKYNYLYHESHSSPRVVLDIFSEFYSHLLKDKTIEHDIDGFENVLFIPSLKIRNSKFIKYLTYNNDHTKISLNETGGGIFEFRITTSKSIKYLINIVSVVLLLEIVSEDKNFYIEDNIALKYLRLLKNVDPVPYTLFYYFKNKLFNSTRSFKKNKDIIDSINILDGNTVVNIENNVYGFNHELRKSFVKEHITGDYNILDMGCGEGQYIKLLYKTVKDSDKKYVAVDIDKKHCDRLSSRYNESEVLSVINSDLLSFIENHDMQTAVGECQVILTEVIEHNFEDYNINVLKYLLEEECVKRIIITTPNKDFNKFYFEDESLMRHDDHVFEYTRKEFKSFIETLPCINNFNILFIDIGDVINGVSPTQAVILERI